MLRLIHSQTVTGAILVDDIDDGLPNKEVHRLGTTADPKAYPKDGYASKPKQSCYVPYSHTMPSGSLVAGFINLQETERVTLSAGKGKIAKMATAGLISTVSLVAADLDAPVVTGAATVLLNFAIAGTTLESVDPVPVTVTFTKGVPATTPSPAVWTQAAILAAGGTISATAITIPTAAFVGQVVVAGNLVTVSANEQDSNTFIST